MPDTEKVELIPGDSHSPLRRYVHMDYEFAKKDKFLTTEKLYYLVEPNLETEEQKNAVKAVLNAFAFGDPRESEIGKHFNFVLDSLEAVYEGDMNANGLMWELKDRLEYVFKTNPDKYYPNLEIALANVYKEPDIAQNISLGINENILEQRKKHNLVPIIQEDCMLNIYSLDRDRDTLQVFPQMSLSAKQLANKIEWKLENDEQRNAVRELLNGVAFTNFDDDYKTMGSNFLNHSAALLQGKLTADSYMDKLYSELKPIAENRHGDAHYKNALTHIRNDKKRVADEKKNAENASESLNVSEASVQKKEENSLGSLNVSEGSVQKQESVNTGKIVKENIGFKELQKKEESTSRTLNVGKASVQKKAVSSSEAHKTMPEKVELKDGFLNPSAFAHLSRDLRKLTYKQIYECVEPGLKTEEQKNAVKAVLNAMDSRSRKDYEIGHSVLSDLSEFYAKNSKLKDAKVNTSASELMEKLKSRIEEVVNSDPQKKVPNLKIALNNINKDLKMVRTNTPGKLQKNAVNTSGILNVSEGSVQKKGRRSL